MKVIFTREARQDLAGIARYLADHNPRRAISYVEELRKACLDIGQMPNAFEIVEDASQPDIRRRVFEPYLIFYRIEKTGIHIVRIIHGARDYLQILSQG
jgi:plasmid stabilization system protein ParE